MTAFNINTLTNHLETRDKLTRYNYILDKDTTCPRCNNDIEDNDHILQCRDTKDKLADIIARASPLLEKEIDILWDKDIVKLNRYEKPTPEILWQITGITTDAIFDSQIARGIITETLITNCKERLSQSTRPITGQKEYHLNLDIIILTIACFRDAIYHEIWKPRTRYIFSENKALEYKHKLDEAKRRKEERKMKKKLPKQNKSKRKAEQPLPNPSKCRMPRVIIYKPKKTEQQQQATSEQDTNQISRSSTTSNQPKVIIFKQKALEERKQSLSRTNLMKRKRQEPLIYDVTTFIHSQRQSSIIAANQAEENKENNTIFTFTPIIQIPTRKRPLTVNKRKDHPSPRKKPKITTNNEA